MNTELSNLNNMPSFIVSVSEYIEDADTEEDAIDIFTERLNQGDYGIEVDTVEGVVELLENISEMAVDLNLPTSGGKQTRGVKIVQKTEYSPKAIAKRYFFAVENKDQDLLDLSRQLLSADKYDRDISLNDKTEDNDYREHIVPCIMIHNQAVKMVQEGCNLSEVSAMIAQNLLIVHIPTSEAARLDEVYQTTMPEGWEFGDDVFARLNTMDIQY